MSVRIDCISLHFCKLTGSCKSFVFDSALDHYYPVCLCILQTACISVASRKNLTKSIFLKNDFMHGGYRLVAILGISHVTDLWRFHFQIISRYIYFEKLDNIYKISCSEYYTRQIFIIFSDQFNDPYEVLFFGLRLSIVQKVGLVRNSRLNRNILT